MSEPKPIYRIEGRERTIFRAKHDPDNPYVTINRNPITDPTLSYKAKGILTYLLSRPDGWEVNVPDLVNHSTDGPAAVRTGLQELRKAGHIHYNTQREGGYIKKWVVEVHETPKPPDVGEEDGDTVLDSDFRNVGASLDSDFLQVENQQVGNRGEVLKILSINEQKIEDKEPLKNSLAEGYWQTILDQIRGDRTIPMLHHARLSEAVPVSMTDHTLLIQIDEPELYNARFSKSLERNIFGALVPGGKIVFQKG